MVLKLYADFLSQPCRAVYIYLKVNSIPFEVVPMSLIKGEHKTQEYAKVAPVQAVPAIDDDGFTLFESAAILKYLANKYYTADNAHWYPSAPKPRALIEEYLGWHPTNTRTNAVKPFFAQIIQPLFGSPDMSQLDEAYTKLNATLETIDAVFLKDTPFINSHSISIADIMAICELTQLDGICFDWKKGHPKLKEWAELVTEKINPHFDEINGRVLYKIRDAFASRPSKDAFNSKEVIPGLYE